MELLGLLGVLFLLYLLIVPLVALVRSARAQERIDALQEVVSLQLQQLTDLDARLRRLQTHAQATPPNVVRMAESPPATAMAPVASAPVSALAPQPPAASRTGEPAVTAPSGTAEHSATPVVPPAPVGFRFDPEDLMPEAADGDSGVHERSPGLAAGPEPLPPIRRTPMQTSAARAVAAPAPIHDWTQDTDFDTSAISKPRDPSFVERWMAAARDWLFGGNLVARVGLLILFIGVAFLLRLAANYVTVPIELRLAGVAAGALALLVWGFRIRNSRPGIALPVQGAALATLMLVTFAAFRLFALLPVGAAFSLLLVLVAFTCVLAVLQDALWLAIFGIVGGFAVPILLSTGGGNHVALFSYYAILNAGVLIIALQRDWRVLNVLGFLFTFSIGTAWGLRSYQPGDYVSTQCFLALFFVFYVAIATIFGWRRAPRLKSTVDGTLVFGVPTVVMGLQAAIVRPYEYGMALSALALGLFYVVIASVLWHLRRQSLKLLVESFFALAVVFGTLAIPLAFDDRWTSAAWALEGAGIVWVGLKQRQALVWRFGVAVQVGSWLAFLKAWYGLDPLSLALQPPGLGMMLMGAAGLFLAWRFQRERLRDDAQPAWVALGGLFLVMACVWLLGGVWIEVWRRVDPLHRVTLLVLTALLLVAGLQRFGQQLSWSVPERLASIVTATAGIAFVLLAGGDAWSRVGPAEALSTFGVLASSGFFGGVLLSAGAMVSALAFHAQETDAARRSSARWYGLAMLWWCAFALRGLCVWGAWLSRGADAAGEWPWYAVSADSLYAVGLGLSAALWTALARWRGLLYAPFLQQVFRPLLSAVAVAWLLLVDFDLPFDRRLDLDWLAAPATFAFSVELLRSPLCGGLIFLALALSGLRASLRQESADPTSFPDRLLWVIGLGTVAILLVIDPLALAIARRAQDAALPWHYAELQTLGLALLVPLGLWLARRWQHDGIRWLAAPAVLTQALLSLILVGQAYGQWQLPALATGLVLVALWLAVDRLLRDLGQRGESPGPVALRLLHVSRVIAPGLLLVPVLALNLEPLLWVPDADPASPGWAWYLGLWGGLGVFLAVLRQVPRAGWPLAPLERWYGEFVLPAAALLAISAVLRWNISHDGRMAPLPYLPLLNPLDLSSGFVALALAALWRLHSAWLLARPPWRLTLLRSAAGLAWLWFNLMLLRSAAVWLELPYRFDALYASQVVQATLSLVWTLAAFLLMRYAGRRWSRSLWMVGAAALGLVVLKLFLVDLSNVGSVARVVSFMGVGGLMLLIGYLAPLPSAARADRAGDLGEAQ